MQKVITSSPEVQNPESKNISERITGTFYAKLMLPKKSWPLECLKEWPSLWFGLPTLRKAGWGDQAPLLQILGATDCRPAGLASHTAWWEEEEFKVPHAFQRAASKKQQHQLHVNARSRIEVSAPDSEGGHGSSNMTVVNGPQLDPAHCLHSKHPKFHCHPCLSWLAFNSCA